MISKNSSHLEGLGVEGYSDGRRRVMEESRSSVFKKVESNEALWYEMVSLYDNENTSNQLSWCNLTLNRFFLVLLAKS